MRPIRLKNRSLDITAYFLVLDCSNINVENDLEVIEVLRFKSENLAERAFEALCEYRYKGGEMPDFSEWELCDG